MPGLPGDANAHPAIDEAYTRLEEADFAAALDAFRRAEATSDLTLPELVRLLAGRALVQHALGDAAGLDRDLALLALVDPEHDFSRQAPPEVLAAFAGARAAAGGRPILEVDVSTPADTVSLEARVSPHAGSLVRQVRLRGRVRGGAWQEATTSSMVLSPPAGKEVQYYALAIGPGGATVARVGSLAEPLRARGRARDRDGATHEPAIIEAPSPSSPPASRGGPSALVWVGVGATVAVMVLVGVLVFSDPSSDATRPSYPEVVDR